MEDKTTSYLYKINNLPDKWRQSINEYKFELLNEKNVENFVQTYIEAHKDSATEVFISGDPYHYAKEAILEDDWTIRSLCKLVSLNDDIVGVILGGQDKDLEKNGKVGILEFVGVIPQFRGKGIGQKLLHIGLCDLNDYGFEYYCDGTLDENIPMIKLFESLEKDIPLLIKGRNWDIDKYLENNQLV